MTVNDVRGIAAAAARSTHNRIAGIGLSAIVYPHDDIVDYLSRRLAIEVTEGDWMRLDRQFEARLRRYREQRNAGNMSVAEPLQPESYVEDLGQLARDQIAFFREIFDALNPAVIPEGSSEPVVVPLHETYLAAFDAYVKDAFWRSDDIRDIPRRASADPSQFASRESLIEEVRRRESRLDGDLRLIDQALVNRPNDIVVNLFSLADDLGERDWRDYHIQTYLMRGGPHLVQSRAFLFLLRLAIEKRLASMSSAEARKRLFRIANVFDAERGAEPDRRGTPATLQTANAVARRGALARLFKGGKGEFVERYVSYYNASLRALPRLRRDQSRRKGLSAAARRDRRDDPARQRPLQGDRRHAGRLEGGNRRPGNPPRTHRLAGKHPLRLRQPGGQAEPVGRRPDGDGRSAARRRRQQGDDWAPLRRRPPQPDQPGGRRSPGTARPVQDHGGRGIRQGPDHRGLRLGPRDVGGGRGTPAGGDHRRHRSGGDLPRPRRPCRAPVRGDDHPHHPLGRPVDQVLGVPSVVARGNRHDHQRRAADQSDRSGQPAGRRD